MKGVSYFSPLTKYNIIFDTADTGRHIPPIRNTCNLSLNYNTLCRSFVNKNQSNKNIACLCGVG